MAISCAYCGKSHATPALVRRCWEQHVSPPVAPAPEPGAVSPTDPADLQRYVVAAGPAVLARGIVVNAGAAIPPEWIGADRLVVDSTTLRHPDVAVAQLTAAAERSRPMVIEMLAPFRDVPRTVTAQPPYTLGAEYLFAIDLLHHLIWANAIDATGAEPRWALIERALTLGASTTPDGRGDLVLPDGSRAWLDGGPLRRREPIEEIAVLHAVCVEHGSLQLAHERLDRNDLAADQFAAVTHQGGSVHVIAPAGSGKTRVLTHRARHLINDWNLPASAVALVAFNKRAQEEMQDRAGDLRGLKVRTLNSIALAILNGTAPFRAQPRTLQTIDEPEVRRIIGRLVQFPRRRNTDPMASWIEALSVIRLGLRDPHEVEQMYNGDVDGLIEMWPRYREVLDRQGCVDFDDQIYRAIELLLTDADVRHQAQRACRVLLVDEFQDLTPAHVLLVRLLSAPDLAVFGVGDDDQTIYGYSGADPRWLIEFTELFSHAAMHPLETNYRCPGDVVQAADRLLRHNERRVAKQIRAASPGGTGLIIDTEADTLQTTLANVSEIVRTGRDPGDIAVLTRVNALLAPVQVGLSVAGIAVRGGVGAEFVERTAVRAVMAWLRLARADENDLAPSDLAEALRRPSRPMHPNVATWVGEQQSITGLRRLAARLNNDRDEQRVNAFTSDIERLQRMARRATTAQLIATLGEDIGLGSSIATLDESRRGMNRAAQNDDLVALAQLGSLQPDVEKFELWLRAHLTQARSPRGVTLATVHRVKGQEWPFVVLHHAQSDQYPHRLAQDLEEERRVFHVAITRCSERVVIVGGHDPSPFIAELSAEFSAELPPTKTAKRTEAKRTPAPISTPRSPVSVFAKGIVFAAPGVAFVDGGQEWQTERIDEMGALCRLNSLTRRFAFGATVVTTGRQRGALSPVPSPVGDPSVRAYDLLRQGRERLRQGKPAYVVFDDATLERIALRLPANAQELARIQGIGPAKLELYGDSIIAIVEDALRVPGESGHIEGGRA